jgi:hypothetical protein
VAAIEDFFGLNNLGADPYHQQMANKLSRFQQMDQILQGQASGGQTLQNPIGRRTGVNQPQGQPQSFTPAAGPNYGFDPNTTRSNGGGPMPGGASGDLMSQLARMFMTRGGGGGYNPGMTGVGRPGTTPSGPQMNGPIMNYQRLDSGPAPNNYVPPEGTPDGQFCPNGQHYDGEKCIANGSGEGDGGDNGGGGTTPPPPDKVGNAGGFGPYNDSTIPADLRGLRGALGSWLQQNFNNYNPKYNGTLNVGLSPWAQQAAGMATDAGNAGTDWMNMGRGTMNGLLDFNTSSDLSSLMGPLQQMMSGQGANFDPSRVFGNADASTRSAAASQNYFDQGVGYGVHGLDLASPYMQNAGGMANLLNTTGLSTTGGAPAIQSQLDNIRNKGMMDIQDQLAQIKEQYGAQGLGAGSDVAEALARGSSRGIADINSQQGALTASIGNSAADRMMQSILGGAGMNQQIGSAYGGLAQNVGNLSNQSGQGILGQSGAYGAAGGLNLQSLMGQAGLNNDALNRILQSLPVGQNILNNPAQMALASAGIRSGAAGMLPGYSQGASSGQLNAAQLLANLAGMDMNRQGNNINMNYQDFVRATTNPYLGTAAGYATGFPPTGPTVSGANPMWGALGTLGAAALPYLGMLSDETMKEDIRELEEPKKPFTKRLKQLPIKTWKYKGDSVRHVGPMAQDMQKVFGIGDGHTIFIPDLLNVMLGVMKETASA